MLVNIFGGIARCTTIATALIEASKTVGFNVPLVVRLEGTEVEEGRKMLAESDVDMITAIDIDRRCQESRRRRRLIRNARQILPPVDEPYFPSINLTPVR